MAIDYIGEYLEYCLLFFCYGYGLDSGLNFSLSLGTVWQLIKVHNHTAFLANYLPNNCRSGKSMQKAAEISPKMLWVFVWFGMGNLILEGREIFEPPCHPPKNVSKFSVSTRKNPLYFALCQGKPIRDILNCKTSETLWDIASETNR